MFLAGKLNSAFGWDLCLAIKHCFCNAVMFPCTYEWKIESYSGCTLTHLLPWSVRSLQTSGSFGIFGFGTFLSAQGIPHYCRHHLD